VSGRAKHAKKKKANLPVRGLGAKQRGSLEESFRFLLDRLEVGVATVSVNGIIRYFNPRFSDMLGARVFESLAGADLKTFVVAGGWPALNEALRRSVRVPSEGQLELEDIPGRKRTIKVSLVPLTRDDSGPLIGIVATDVTQLLETANALKTSAASLQSLSARFLQLQDEERRHLARDLHDTIGQELAVAAMWVDQIVKEAESPSRNIRKPLLECGDLLRKIESETRTLSYVLHPPLLDQTGLLPALGWFIDGFTKRSGIKVRLDARDKIPRLDIDQEIALFRVVQESLTNVLRHSGSAEATVELAVENGNIRISIEDHGKGLRQKSADEPASLGVGIPGMRGRLSLVKGKLDVQSGPQGTTVTATVPLMLDSAVYVGEDSAPVAEWAAGNQIRTFAEGGKARILIADDHEIARRGIMDLFRDEPDLEICGEASDGLDTLFKVHELQPDLLILDLSMPKMGGFSVAHRLQAIKSPVKILVYTNHSHDIERMARSVGCGGCVHKANAARDLVRGVRAVLQGGTFYDHEVQRSARA
jgi:PAS domain S-box-containing protein